MQIAQDFLSRAPAENPAHSGLCKGFSTGTIGRKDKQDAQVIIEQFLSEYKMAESPYLQDFPPLFFIRIQKACILHRSAAIDAYISADSSRALTARSGQKQRMEIHSHSVSAAAPS